MNYLFRFSSPFAIIKFIGLSKLCLVSIFAFSYLSVSHQAIANEAQPPLIGACVICNEPGKVYQCTYKHSSYQPDATGQYPNINVKGLQFACIEEIAQYGGHGQCAAVRKSLNECNGELYQLKNSTSVQQILLPLKPETDQTQHDNAAKPDLKKQPTLVDETKKTYQKTTKTVKKTFDNTSETVKKTYDKTSNVMKKSVKSVGKGIGDAASTTYECITSFFSKCGN